MESCWQISSGWDWRLAPGHHGPEGEQGNPHSVSSTIVLGMIKIISLKSFQGEQVVQEGGLHKVSGGAVLGRINVEPGDVFLLLDIEAPKGSFFSFGEIVKVNTDEDKIVKKLTLQYKIKNTG